MKRRQAGELPEKTGYTKYFEHDGALRAYANRMMWFGISAVLISFVLALLLWQVHRAKTPEQKDLAFGLTCVAMLLLSPVAWDHYFCLLLVPLALWWLRLPPDSSLRGWFLLLLALSWINPKPIWDAVIGGPGGSGNPLIPQRGGPPGGPGGGGRGR